MKIARHAGRFFARLFLSLSALQFDFVRCGGDRGCFAAQGVAMGHENRIAILLFHHNLARLRETCMMILESFSFVEPDESELNYRDTYLTVPFEYMASSLEVVNNDMSLLC